MAATYSNRKRKLEKYIQVVREDGLNTDQNVNIGVTGTPNLWVAGNLSVGGTTSFTSDVITSTSANAFAVGANGTTNPVFNIDSSETNVATGIQIEGQVAGGAVNIETLSSGTNENLTLDAKGSGTIGINQVSTNSGLVTIGNGTSRGGAAVNGNFAIVQPSGISRLDINSTRSWSIASGYQDTNSISLIDVTNTNKQLLIFNGNNGGVTINSAAASALIVGAGTPAANPAFNIDASTGSSVTGLNIKSAAAAGGLAVTTTSSGTDESLTIAAKGAGTTTINPAVVATAGGAANDGIRFGSLNVGLFTGTGAPSFSAMNGSVYVDSNATTTTTRIYVNKSGAGTAGTTWTNLTTAA